ncbi:hypothetical protein [Planctomyces sp. SH-PL62]|uniref:hypothetical protein n=1 Tax=Planctomyces sp. SH-PL62 TaxID=1636152 RepID=UPI00078C6163|nr:hypothetical protein [Planctomyces sp. SH-PL62]AMV37702.1 hypothetical protein VT85_09715 [Planctomyces sp. SH-PL62]
MKILYLKPEHGRPFFYADPCELAVDESAKPTGVRAWAERKWAEMEARWKESEGTAARWSRRAWDWLHSGRRPDEELLARLGAVDVVVVRHPASLPERKARTIWKRYLARRARSHLFWLIVDGVLAPVTGLLLWLVPGPNVVGFWFTYRAFNHYVIVRALHRARWNPPPTTFEADEALDAPIHLGVDGPSHPAVEDGESLRQHLERRKATDDATDPHDEHEHHGPAGSDVKHTGQA